MRLLLVFVILILAGTLKAQTTFPGFAGDVYTNSLYHNQHLYDTASPKKWFVSRYIGLNAGYSIFRGGSAAIVSTPLSLQLNRRLNNNLYAFAGVTVAPSYINFSRTFVNTDLSKVNTNNTFFRSSHTGVYSSAALGLMYVNDARTFSISGSISIERDNYPMYYYQPVNTTKPKNNMPDHR
jgi:hypothetical protein